MARAAVIGDPLQVAGFALAGAVVCPADDQDTARAAWRSLPADIAVVLLTPQAAAWIGEELALRRDVLPAVMPA